MLLKILLGRPLMNRDIDFPAQSAIRLMWRHILFLFYFNFIQKIWRKWLLIFISVLLIFFGTMVYFKDVEFIKSLPGSRIFDISFNTLNFQSRMVMWQIAFDGFKERPILGWGPENFTQVFDK